MGLRNSLNDSKLSPFRSSLKRVRAASHTSCVVGVKADAVKANALLEKLVQFVLVGIVAQRGKPEAKLVNVWVAA
jgi:hypothetical protein